ncbi:MAG TPA: 1-acyl-sn-glycerol-3-phosphate acyltransferase [Jatrophihabitans sp.]|nr:1-acyl-sn-glycerol-3-phosphate acyltransferase [Jatrophihabitans sp.]
MSWVPPRAVRRVVLDPLWVPLAAALVVVLSAVLLLAGVCVPFGRKHRLLRVTAFALVYVYLDVGLMLSGGWYWLRSPRRHRDVAAWHARHSALLGRALSTLMSVAGTLFGYRVELVGRDLMLDPVDPLVVLARHAGPGDSFTLVHMLITTLRRNPRVVLKRVLQWDPGLDVVLTRLDCYFLPSSSGAGEDRAVAVAELVSQLTPDDALLLFPEGGNWTPRRHRRSVLRLLRAGQRERARQVSARSHVLPPRPGGTSAALAVRPDTDVLVIAHTGLDVLVNPRQMWEALPLQNRPMRIRGWLHQAAELPRDDASIQRWLDEQWALVDRWIDTQQPRG